MHTAHVCTHTHTQKNNGPVVLQSISQGVTVDTAISLTEPEQLHSSPQIYKHTDPHTHSSLIADSSARDGWLCVCGPRGECCTLVRVSLGQISHKRSKAVTVPELYTFYHIQQLQTNTFYFGRGRHILHVVIFAIFNDLNNIESVDLVTLLHCI